jgi:hypothetical protein
LSRLARDLETEPSPGTVKTGSIARKGIQGSSLAHLLVIIHLTAQSAARAKLECHPHGLGDDERVLSVASHRRIVASAALPPLRSQPMPRVLLDKDVSIKLRHPQPSRCRPLKMT